MLRLMPALVVALLISACGPGKGGEGDGAESLEQARTQDEAIAVLQRKVDDLATATADLQALALKLNTLANQIDSLRQALAEYRAQIQSGKLRAGRRAEGTDWLTEALVFLMGVTVTLILYFALRLLRGYDEGELPPEAYTPGLTTTAPPTEEESANPTHGPGGEPPGD